MGIQIHILCGGTSGGLLIDTDYVGTLPVFYKALKKNNISMTDITYVLATHYHPDHIGLISELTKFGIKLLLLDTQYNYVHYADEIFKWEKHLRYEPIDEKNAIIVACKTSRAFLAKLGIAGEIIPTTSHSKDSISDILDNGEYMVGDLEPMEYLDAKVIYYAHANEKHFI